MRVLSLVAISLTIAGAASAQLNVAGFDFADGERAFADNIGIVSGTVTGFPESAVRSILVGSDVSDSIRVIDPDVAVIELLFTDNAIVNEAGTDLVIFERSGHLPAGTADPTERFGVSVFDGVGFPPFVDFDPVSTAIDVAGLTIFVVEIDLSDFGLPDGATTQRIRIRLFDTGIARSADPTAAGALHSVPVPTELEICEGDLAQALADLEATQVALDECLARPSFADEDGDGEHDRTDLCPGTPPGEAVDSDGCSLAQFCAGIDPNERGGLARCYRADFGNHGRPSCRHQRLPGVPVHFACIPR